MASRATDSGGREGWELSEKAHYEQFDPDPDTGEPPIFTPATARMFNKRLEKKMGEPIDLDSDGWWTEDRTYPKEKSATTVSQ